MPDYVKTVGNVELISLTDGLGSRNPVDVFPVSNIDIWRDEYADLLDDQDLIHPRYGSVAVRSCGKLIIVDTGDGPPNGQLLGDMQAKGVSRDEVNLVVLTHLHGDHVGWNLTFGRPTFPNARYLIPKADYEYWTGPEVIVSAPRVESQVMPLDELNVMDLIEGEYQITDEVTALPTPGHTPGHTSFMIHSGGDTAIILGDVAHSPAQAHYTNWSPAFDVDPDVARSTRHRVLDKVEQEGSLICAGHFPDPGFGLLLRKRGRRYWQDV